MLAVRLTRCALLLVATQVVAAPSSVSAASAPGTSSYGVLAQTVATAGSLIAAATALSLCWKGRFAWEPAEQDIPRSAQKVGGLMIALIIAIMWYRFTKQDRLTPDDLISLSIVFGAIALTALVIYGMLIGVYVYAKTVVVGGTTTAQQRVIGGFWLTSAARTSLKSGNPKPGTIGELFAGAAYNEDLVWPRVSRSLAKACFQLSYVALIAGGTCALAAVSLLIAAAT